MLRRSLLKLSHSDNVKNLVTAMPVSSGVVSRFVPGESVDQAADATEKAHRRGPGCQPRPSW
ncbi:MAG: hypothetical protein WKF73_16895 [Nocardioidaceae bacterium]